MSQTNDNVRRVRDRIAAAACLAGRDPGEIALCAVSKMVPVERIREAINAGITELGENYYQEAAAKLDQLPSDVRWHFIGHLQTNKAKGVVGRFAVVQSVDRPELADALNRRAEAAGVVQPVLVEVKLDPAHTKSGVPPNEAMALAYYIGELNGLRLQGLMGMPPPCANADAARPYFARLRELFDSLPEPTRKILSMGMTADFEAAIKEGSTLVRVGTAIFGSRAGQDQ